MLSFAGILTNSGKRRRTRIPGLIFQSRIRRMFKIDRGSRLVNVEKKRARNIIGLSDDQIEMLSRKAVREDTDSFYVNVKLEAFFY